MIKIIKLSAKGQVVIPKKFREKLVLKKGETLLMYIKQNRICIMKFDNELYNKIIEFNRS